MPANFDLRPSPTLAMNELASGLAATGLRIHRFGFGQSPFSPPPHIVEALRQNAWRHAYLTVQGLLPLRESVAAFQQERHKLTYTPEDIVIGPGSKELLFLLQMVYQGELLLPSPSWVSYEPQARMLGLPVKWLATLGPSYAWQLDLDALERHCQSIASRPRLLLINYPNNPTGTSPSEEHLASLAAICRRYGLLVVTDEIYGELHHRGMHVSLARDYPEGTIITSGLSKWCAAGGWRVGTISFPKAFRPLLKRVCAAASETFSAVNAPAQYAAVAAYSGGPVIDRFLNDSRRVLSAIGNWCCDELNAAGVPTAKPDGGFYLFPRFLTKDVEMTSAELCDQLLRNAGVSMLPGSHFGRPASELTCRLAYVDFDGTRALANANAIEGDLGFDFVKESCSSVVEGIEALVRLVRGI